MVSASILQTSCWEAKIAKCSFFGEWYESARQSKIYILYINHTLNFGQDLQQLSRFSISPQIFQLSCSVHTELYFQVFQDWKVFKIILYFLQSCYNLKIQPCFKGQILLDKRNERCLLQEQAFITHISTHPRGAGSSQRVRAVFSERQDGFVNDFDGLSNFILLDDEGRRQADDVTVRGLGQEPVIAEPQTHLPRIVVCKGREGGHQTGHWGHSQHSTRGVTPCATPAARGAVCQLAERWCRVFTKGEVTRSGSRESAQGDAAPELFVSIQRVLLLHSSVLVWHSVRLENKF